MATPSIDTTKIAETAYQIWLESGQPDGRDQEHWFAAIDRLSAAAPLKATAKPAVKKKAPARKKRAAKAK